MHLVETKPMAHDKIDPVVIAGAGPAGCALALMLAQNDVPVVLLEKDADLPMDLRASTFHPSSLDLLDSLNITDKLIEVGLKVHDYQYRDRRTGWEIPKGNDYSDRRTRRGML